MNLDYLLLGALLGSQAILVWRHRQFAKELEFLNLELDATLEGVNTLYRIFGDYTGDSRAINVANEAERIINDLRNERKKEK